MSASQDGAAVASDPEGFAGGWVGPGGQEQGRGTGRDGRTSGDGDPGNDRSRGDDEMRDGQGGTTHDWTTQAGRLRRGGCRISSISLGGCGQETLQGEAASGNAPKGRASGQDASARVLALAAEVRGEVPGETRDELIDLFTGGARRKLNLHDELGWRGRRIRGRVGRPDGQAIGGHGVVAELRQRCAQ